MNIVALSDMHGKLPSVTTPCDLICICGDISPINYEKYYKLMLDWFSDDFLPWVKLLPCKKVLFIAGNHDHMMEFPNWKIDYVKLVNKHNLASKILDITNSICTFTDPETEKPVMIYGFSYTAEKYTNAFHTFKPAEVFQNIPLCDILISHCAPNLNNVGTSADNVERGEPLLKEAIQRIKPKLVLCGHVHTGSHRLESIQGTTICNCSIVDNTFSVNYRPQNIYLKF